MVGRANTAATDIESIAENAYNPAPGDVSEWSTKLPGAILNRIAARRAEGRMPAVKELDSI